MLGSFGKLTAGKFNFGNDGNENEPNPSPPVPPNLGKDKDGKDGNFKPLNGLPIVIFGDGISGSFGNLKPGRLGIPIDGGFILPRIFFISACKLPIAFLTALKSGFPIFPMSTRPENLPVNGRLKSTFGKFGNDMSRNLSAIAPPKALAFSLPSAAMLENKAAVPFAPLFNALPTPDNILPA